jgi:hypothetical protein
MLIPIMDIVPFLMPALYVADCVEEMQQLLF